MRVAFVAMETTRHADAAGVRRVERLARLLADRGHDVTVFCAQWWDGYEQTREQEGVTYHGVTVDRALASFCARLPYVLARHRPDVVHASPRPVQQVFAAGAGRRLARAPLVLEWFGDEGLDRDHWLTGRAVRTPDAVTTPSEMVRTTVREMGADEGATDAIPESIDFSLVEAVEPATEIDVAFAHPLDDTANLEDLLLGLAELRELDWRATVIGDGPRRSAYERQAADLRIEDRLTFAGACDRERRLEIYRGAHAFVQTAYREYFPTELLWALAAGCVGIVEYQAHSSAHELIENYERSFRVTDPQGLADAIVSAGDFERLTVDDHWGDYDHDTVIREYVDMYTDLIEDYGWF